MIELRSNICVTSVKVDSVNGTNILLNPVTHQLDQVVKANICYIQAVSDPSDGFVGGALERAKPANEETSQKATISP